jgi:predicted amidophosphoribosyltransferase
MSTLETLGELLAHFLWPVSCPVCGAVGKPVCGDCLRSLPKHRQPRCLWCGEPVPCKIHKAGTPKILTGFVYEGRAKDLILALKYGKYRTLGPRLGKALAVLAARPKADVLVPVPLHPNSKRRYNQAEAIAEGLGEAWGIEVLNAARWVLDVSPRAGASRAERFSLASDAFGFDADIAGLRVGLVDDVCTTGTTLARLAEAARDRGAEVLGAFAAAGSPFAR